jgi:glycosyltransferase involved in cell wall biosynthesis
VSAIIIFFDAERWLAEAIDSVRAQTLGDWELLLVDDGSRDGGPALARVEAARAPDRVRYLQHPGHQNRGMSAARNLGLRHARGQSRPRRRAGGGPWA